MRAALVALVPGLPLRAQIAIDVIEQAVELLLCCSRLGLQFRIFFAHLAGHAHLFELHVQIEDLFEQIGRNARWIFAVFAILAGVLFADLRAVQLEQILGAADRIFQRAIGVVEQRGVGQAPLLFVLLCAGKAIGMQLAAEVVELVLEHAEIEIELRHETEDRKIIAARRRLNLAAVRTE